MRFIYVLIFSGFLSFLDSGCDSTRADNAKETKQDKGKKDKKNKKEKESVSAGVKVEQKWELPDILQEISGFAYISPNRFACVQDEAGAIFIYNTAEEKIEKQISFGASGDYEGLALAGKTAFVIRSDGQLFRVENIDSRDKPAIKSYTTGLTAKNNVEGLTYDAKNNRLLIAIKGSETSETDFKGIYAFDLTTQKLIAEPVFKINLKDEAFQNRQVKNVNAAIQPADLALNPTTEDLYVVEATNPQLVILNKQGNIKNRFVLSSKEFSQPEGLTFSPNGDFYIANEGKKEPGNILKISLTNQPAEM